MSGIRSVDHETSTVFALAGLGGNVGYLKNYVDSSWYFPIFEESTIHIRGRAGWLSGAFGKQVPLYHKFYVGGLDTIRALIMVRQVPKTRSPGRRSEQIKWLSEILSIFSRS